ncbi:MAG TPA: hypothetical protein VEJ18_18105, partial [Planctomycetota bacterium]|nr:hypothetical protein [Planctomycetota bacterium]
MNDDFLFGDIAVAEGFLTRDQLEKVARERDGKPLDDVLVERGVLTPDQVKTIHDIARIQAAEALPGESEGR